MVRNISKPLWDSKYQDCDDNNFSHSNQEIKRQKLSDMKNMFKIRCFAARKSRKEHMRCRRAKDANYHCTPSNSSYSARMIQESKEMI